MTRPYHPLILIGAARSGTKLVRDVIAAHPAVDKVPYDINYVWRLGNEGLPHDELAPDLLTPAVRQRIWQEFERYHTGSFALVEKTVSNALRIAYVQAVFPEARFIHLIRDGRDVVESVYRQWLAPPDWRYIAAKVRTFPITQAFGYGLAYAGRITRKLLNPSSQKTGTWGPRYAGIDQDIATRELLEVCAIQWSRSVEKALAGLSSSPSDRVYILRYESFVQEPRRHLTTLAQFIGLDPDPYANLDLSGVTSHNIGKGWRTLTQEQKALVLPHMAHTLSLLEYVT